VSACSRRGEAAGDFGLGSDRASPRLWPRLGDCLAPAIPGRRSLLAPRVKTNRLQRVITSYAGVRSRPSGGLLSWCGKLPACSPSSGRPSHPRHSGESRNLGAAFTTKAKSVGKPTSMDSGLRRNDGGGGRTPVSGYDLSQSQRARRRCPGRPNSPCMTGNTG